MTVVAPSSSTSRTPSVESEQTVSENVLSSSPQPFTDVLTEATSKVLLEGLEKPEASKLSQKGEATKGFALEDAKEVHSRSSSKKSVVIDISPPPIPIIVQPVPLVITDTAPVIALTSFVKEPSPKQDKIDALTTIDVQALKPSPMILNVDAAKHPGLEQVEVRESELGSQINAASPQFVEIAQVVESLDKSSTLTAKSANPVTDKGEITVSPPLSVSDRAIATEVHSTSAAATSSTVETKPTHPREPSIRVTSKSAAPMTEHASPTPIRTQPEVVPIWPTQPSVVVSGGNAIATPAHINQSTPHSLDVGALVGAISRPLVEARDGYTVMIAMHPVELGHLQAVVTLHGSDLHVLITPQTQMGHDALTQVVETLKTELSRGGVNVNVTLQDPGSQPRGGDRPQVTTVPRDVFTQEDSVVIASSATVLSLNQINLVL